VFVSATALVNVCRSGVVSAMRGAASPDYIYIYLHSQIMWPDLEECALENSVVLLILVM